MEKDVKVPLARYVYCSLDTTQIEKFTLYVLSIAHPVLLQTTRSEYSYTINTLFGTQDVTRNTFYYVVTSLSKFDHTSKTYCCVPYQLQIYDNSLT